MRTALVSVQCEEVEELPSNIEETSGKFSSGALKENERLGGGGVEYLLAIMNGGGVGYLSRPSKKEL